MADDRDSLNREEGTDPREEETVRGVVEEGEEGEEEFEDAEDLDEEEDDDGSF